MVKVSGSSLRAMRQRQEGRRSVRALAGRMLDHPTFATLSDEERAKKQEALRQLLRRIEESEGDYEIKPEEFEALAWALGVEDVDELSEELLWVWHLPNNPIQPVFDLAEHVVAFTDADEAKRLRSLLQYLGWDDAKEIELRATTRERLPQQMAPELQVAERVDWPLREVAEDWVIVDPDDDTFPLLVLVEDFMRGARADFDAAAPALWKAWLSFSGFGGIEKRLMERIAIFARKDHALDEVAKGDALRLRRIGRVRAEIQRRYIEPTYRGFETGDEEAPPA